MDKPKEQPKFYTTEDVGKILRVDPETIRRYVQVGKLRAIKLSGKFIRIDQKDLEDFIKKMEIKPKKGK